MSPLMAASDVVGKTPLLSYTAIPLKVKDEISLKFTLLMTVDPTPAYVNC